MLSRIGFRLVFLIIFFALQASIVRAVPPTISIQGSLAGSDGKALTGVRVWRVQFYDAQTGGHALGSAFNGVFASQPSGRFSIDLTPPAEVLAASGEVWYELAVDSAPTADAVIDPGDVFPNRVAVHSVLFAQRAAQALSADTAAASQQADRATTATNALAVGGVPAANLVTDTELTSRLATRAELAHTHNLNVLAGAVTDAQVPNSITINHAGSADTAYQLQGEAFLMVRTTDNPATNATNLSKTYADAKTRTPYGAALSSSNRIVVIVPPGQYDFGTRALTLDTKYVDVEGLLPDHDKQHLYGTANGANTGVLMQTANSVRIENLYVECTRSDGVANYDNTDPAAYFPNTDLPYTVVRNCRFAGNDPTVWSTRIGVVEYSGTYEDCEGGTYSFGGHGGTASGTFTNCTTGSSGFGSGSGGLASGRFTNCSAGYDSFGGAGGRANGTFRDCRAGTYSFGGNVGGIASGTFTNCSGAGGSFGGAGGTASGTFTNCTGMVNSFGGNGGTASGTFINCTGEESAFGGKGTASGTFINCVGRYSSFGGAVESFGDGSNVASGTFINCTGKNYSFGYDGTASGTFNNCTAEDYAFGYSGTAPGGKFYYCSGGLYSFTTNAGTGTAPVHRYCLKNGAVYP
ncbi:MAG TPA: hypothetical protein PLA90_09605 [Candidatus Sumerlaeota bacterium]|nr:hypothetical protein [Candidatus Sumerlaeota bacterium]